MSVKPRALVPRFNAANTGTRPLFRDTFVSRRLTDVQARLWAVCKWTRWKIASIPKEGRKAIFVVGGYGQSGRSTICGILDKDHRTTFFRETSSITGAGRDRYRLKPWDEIKCTFDACRTPLIVVETKVESQNTPEILANIPGSQAIWMYRHYQDAVHANLQRWHGQVTQLIPLVEGDQDDWRSQGISAQTRDIVRQLYSPAMSRADAGALSWYARNVLFFERDIQSNPDVLICNYEDLCSEPALVMRRVYDFIGFPFPGDWIVRGIDHRSVGTGADVVLRAEVDRLCSNLMDRLNECRYQVASHRHAAMSEG